MSRRMTDGELLELIGEALVGREWRRPLARMLGGMRSRLGLGASTLDPRLVRRVAADQEPAPTWWWVALERLLADRTAVTRRALIELRTARPGLTLPRRGPDGTTEEGGA